MNSMLLYLLLVVCVATAQDYDEVRGQNKWWSDYANLYDYDDAELDKMMNLIITKNILPGDAPLPLDERLFFRAPGSSEEVEFVPIAPSPPPRRKTSRPPSNRRPPTTTPPPVPSSSPRSEPTRPRIFPSSRRPLFRPFVTTTPPPTAEPEEENEADSREDVENDFNNQPEIRPLPVPDSRPEFPQASVLSDSQNVFVTRGTEAPKSNLSPNRLPFVPPSSADQRHRLSSPRPISDVSVSSPIPPAAQPPINATPRPLRVDNAGPLPSSVIPPKFFSSTSLPLRPNAPNFTPTLQGRFPLTDFSASPVNGGSSLPPPFSPSLHNPPNSFQSPVPPNPSNIPNPHPVNGAPRRTQVLKRRLRPSSTVGPLDDIEDAEPVNEKVPPATFQLTHDVSRVRNQNPRLQPPPTASESTIVSKATKKPLGNAPVKASSPSLNSFTDFAPSRTFTPPPFLNPHLSSSRAGNRSFSIPPQPNEHIPRNQGLSQPQQFSRGTTLRPPFPPNAEVRSAPSSHPFQGNGERFQSSPSTLSPPPLQSGPHQKTAVKRRPVIVSSTHAPLDDVQPRSPEHEVRGRVRVPLTTPNPTHTFISSPPPRSSTLSDQLSDIHISSNTEIIPPSALREPTNSQRLARIQANRSPAGGVERSSTRFQRDESRQRNAMLISASSSPVGMAAKPDGSFEFVPDVDDLNLLSQLSALSDNSLPSTTLSPNSFHNNHYFPEAIKFIFGPVEDDRLKNTTFTSANIDGTNASSDDWIPPCVQNGRNFCLYTEFYPNVLVERVVKENVAEVRNLFNELRSFEKPSVSTPHSEDNGQYVCESQAGAIRPGWVRDTNTGKWMVVVNTQKFSQVVRIETCSRPNEACLFIAPYYRSSCREHHSIQRLVAIDPQSSHPSPQVALVQMPCGCSCMVGTGQSRQSPIR